MKNIMSFIAGFFKEDNGNPSGIRFITIFGCLIIFGILVVQVSAQIWFTHMRGHTDYSPDWNNCLAYLGFLLAGKIVQKTQEQKIDCINNPNQAIQ